MEECSDSYFAVLDSGASASIFSLETMNLFAKVIDRVSYVSCANDQVMVGAKAASQGLLQDVLFHDTSKNLISASRLVDEGCRIVLDKVSSIEFKSTKLDVTTKNGIFYINKQDTLRLMESNVHYAGVLSEYKKHPLVRNLPSWMKENLRKRMLLRQKEAEALTRTGVDTLRKQDIDLGPKVNTRTVAASPVSEGTSVEAPNVSSVASGSVEYETHSEATDCFADDEIQQSELSQVQVRASSEMATQTDPYYNKLYRDATPSSADPQIRDLMKSLTKSRLMYAHQMWGHPSLSWMKIIGPTLVDEELKELIRLAVRIRCPVCMLAKMKVKTHKSMNKKNRIKTPFKCIAIDWVSKHKFLELTGEDDNLAKGFFLCVDYFSSFVMIYPALSKDEAPFAISFFIQEILRLGLRVEEVRSDAGGEFVSRKFANVLNPYAIAHTTATASQQWQNGKGERAVQTVMSMARCLLADAGLTEDLWISAARHAACLINNLVVKGKLKSPRQLIGLENLDLDKLPRFGQLGVAKTSVVDGNAQLRGEPCLFLTVLNERDSRFLVFLKNSGRVVKRENVVFFEDIIGADAEEFAALAEAKKSFTDPKTIKAALNSPERVEWIAAIQKEVHNLKLHRTLEEVDGYVDAKLLRSFVLLKTSVKNDGGLNRKARFVAMGNLQDVDPDESLFAPTCSLGVNLLLDNIAMCFAYGMAILDVAAAFLKGRNSKDEYVIVDKEFAEFLGAKKNIFKIVGNLYGTRQAPQIWFDTFTKVLFDLGFKQSSSSLTLFMRGSFGMDDSIILSVYVDDLKVLYKSTKGFEDFKKDFEAVYSDTVFHSKFDRFLGVDYVVEKDHISIGHSDYIEKCIKPECDYQEGHSYKLPKLHLLEDGSVPDISNCLRLAGLMRFIADRARPDIQFHLNEIVSGVYKDPLGLLKSVARYLVSTKDRRAFFRASNEFALTAFCDASHLRTSDSKSRLAVAIFCNNASAPFFSLSSKVSDHFTTISISSCEAEVKAIYEAAIALEFFTGVVRSLGIEVMKTPTIMTDNASAITIIKRGEGNSRIRHINTRILYVHHLVKNGLMNIEKVASEDNKSDFLTKYFTSNSFEEAAAKFLAYSPQQLSTH